MAIPNQDLKVCSKCRKKKPLDSFYLNGTRYKGRRYRLAECKVCTRERGHAWYRANRQHVLARGKIYLQARRAEIREAAFIAYGGHKCVCCGETEKLFLTLDHINNDGGKWRTETLGKRTMAGFHTYVWLLKKGFPKIMQVMCMNCQHGKLMNQGVCPHQSSKGVTISRKT